MADNVIYDFQFQRGSPDRWAELNPVLRSGEPGVEIGTGLFKIGDGHTPWNSLAYYLTQPNIEAIVDIKIAAGGGSGSDPRIGNLNELTTESKATIVEAINEINMDGVEFVLLYDNAKAG